MHKQECAAVSIACKLAGPYHVAAVKQTSIAAMQQTHMAATKQTHAGFKAPHPTLLLCIRGSPCLPQANMHMGHVGFRNGISCLLTIYT